MHLPYSKVVQAVLQIILNFRVQMYLVYLYIMHPRCTFAKLSSAGWSNMQPARPFWVNPKNSAADASHASSLQQCYLSAVPFQLFLWRRIQNCTARGQRSPAAPTTTSASSQLSLPLVAQILETWCHHVTHVCAIGGGNEARVVPP